MKELLKKQSVLMRKRGMSYSEILKQIPISKSTLSLWLRSVGLSKKQKQNLTEKKQAGMRRGANARRKERITRSKAIIQKTEAEFQSVIDDEISLKIIGVVLYWAEGAKQKEHNISQGVVFSNSDLLMIKIFLSWLGKICHVDTKAIEYELYIHESGNIKQAVNYWKTNLQIDTLKIRYKKHTITKRKNIGAVYNGMLRVRVRRSTDLNRKITGWIKGICNICGVV